MGLVQVSVQFPGISVIQYWTFYTGMLFISLLEVFTKNFESIGLIPHELQRLEK
jgi:hypothetical protein